jgi:hypothetical protein
MIQDGITVFVSYAHEDDRLWKELGKHLSQLKWEKLINVWHDRDISAGAEWEHEISTHLNTAQIILLLISPDFMASEYCYSVEMKRAVEKHQAGEAYVIPIILRPIYWKGAPFSTLQALPTDAKPITTWPDQDEAFLNVVEGIRETIGKLMVQAPSEKIASSGYQTPSDRNPASGTSPLADSSTQYYWLGTDKADIRIGLSSSFNNIEGGKLATSQPSIVVAGRVVGLPDSGPIWPTVTYSITARIGGEQGGSTKQGHGGEIENGFWKISDIRLDAAEPYLSFEIQDKDGKPIARSKGRIKIVKS